MKKWLVADPENVVVVHCMSGKGRAGTAICCLLLYLGFYEDIYKCAQHFSLCRFSDNKGLS
jgi:protein tyrosine phosphatase